MSTSLLTRLVLCPATAAYGIKSHIVNASCSCQLCRQATRSQPSSESRSSRCGAQVPAHKRQRECAAHAQLRPALGQRHAARSHDIPLIICSCQVTSVLTRSAGTRSSLAGLMCRTRAAASRTRTAMCCCTASRTRCWALWPCLTSGRSSPTVTPSGRWGTLVGFASFVFQVGGRCQRVPAPASSPEGAGGSWEGGVTANRHCGRGRPLATACKLGPAEMRRQADKVLDICRFIRLNRSGKPCA